MDIIRSVTDLLSDYLPVNFQGKCSRDVCVKKCVKAILKVEKPNIKASCKSKNPGDKAATKQCIKDDIKLLAMDSQESCKVSDCPAPECNGVADCTAECACDGVEDPDQCKLDCVECKKNNVGPLKICHLECTGESGCGCSCEEDCSDCDCSDECVDPTSKACKKCNKPCNKACLSCIKKCAQTDKTTKKCVGTCSCDFPFMKSKKGKGGK